MENLNDPKNIAGLSNLIRDDDLESNLDLAELEREIANGTTYNQVEEVNVANEYRKEIERLSRNFDLEIHSQEKKPTISPINSPETSPEQSYRSISANKSNNTYDRNSYNSPKLSKSEYRIESPREYRDTQLKNMTMEEDKQYKINKVLGDIDDKELEFSVEKEKDEDRKASLMEQIDMLKITLEDDGIDISGIPPITKNSSITDVQNIYKILRLKNDRNRYCSFAEELILSGSYGMEYLFNGEKEWFGKKPDLTGWSSTVKVKLRRMRYETSSFVQEIMQEYNLSPGIRLALELIPSMFLYSRNRRLSHNDNLVSDSDYKNAISNLNSM